MCTDSYIFIDDVLKAGLTGLGGTNNLGTVFTWDPITNVYTKKIDLDAANGNTFLGSLISVGSKFWIQLRVSIKKI